MSAQTFDELAVDLRLNHTLPSGVNYARRAQQTSKSAARKSLLHLFTRKNWPEGLRLLTMPGLDWKFERAVLDMRESGRGLIRPRRTMLTAVESSYPIWAASCLRMPGAKQGLNYAIETPPFAKAVARSETVRRFYCCTFEEFVAGSTTDWRLDWSVGAAWIDLCGPLTMPRLEALEALWPHVERHLIVTSLHARWPADVSTILTEIGGVTALLEDALAEAIAHHEMRYMDGSPMHQVVLTRIASAS